MANIGNSDFSMKPNVDMASIASLFQKKATDEQTMKLQQSQIQSQEQDRVMNVMKMATDLTQSLVKSYADGSMKHGRDSVSELLGQSQDQVPTNVMKPVGSSMVPGMTEAPTTQSFGSTPEYQDQMQRSLAQGYPEEYGKAKIESLLKPKVPTLQAKNVMVDGTPAVLNYNPQTGGYQDMQGSPVEGKIEPYNQNAVEPSVTDDDRKKYAGLVQRLIDGKATAADFATSRGPLKTKLAMMAAEKDPSYDPTNVPQRVALRKEFTNGSSAKNLTSLNTVIGHLDSLEKAAGSLDNAKLKRYNSVANYMAKETGAPEVLKFNAARNAVASELGKVFQGAGVVTEEEKKSFREDLNAANSPEQIKGVTETYIDLIKSRTDAIKANWTQTMGSTPPPTPFLNSKSKNLLEKHGYDSTTMERTSTGLKPTMKYNPATGKVEPI